MRVGRLSSRSPFRPATALVVALAFGMGAAACAPSVSVSLPGGTPRPEPAAPAWFAEATRGCRTVHTWSAELGLAGRVRGQVVRGRALAGTTSAGDVRLEILAPFGSPVAILVASRGRATLLLPREGRVLRDAAVPAVLDALAGLPLTGADLHALLTGCVVDSPVAADGRAYDRGWAEVDLGEGRSVFLRQGPLGWRVEAARLRGLTIGYSAFAGQAPGEIALVSAASRPGDTLRMRVRLAQVEPNVTLGPEAFTIDVPPDAQGLTVEELRQRGLALGER